MRLVLTCSLLLAPVLASNECSNNTLSNGTAIAAGTTCRAAATICDVAEVCDGTSLDCPVDVFQPNTTVARPAAGLCDVQEFCSGVDANVPAGDVLKANGTTCRAAATDCDLAEVCDGVSASCPVDVFKSDTAVARPSAGLCDVQELCTGLDASIPANVFKDQGTVCRAAVSMCDVQESCSGSSATCPVDGFAPSSTLVHASTSNDDCDPAEYCSGVSATVPANVENCTRIAIDVKGQSGKFSVFDQTKGTSDPNKVTIELDYLYEIAADGESKVGNTGNTKHSIQTFAAQSFQIDDPVDATLRNGSVHAQKVRFSSPVSSIGKITVDTYIMKSSGTVGTDTESWAVRANDLKFNIILSEWSFCAPCGNGNNAASSEFIDVAVKIKGKGAAPEKKGNANNITYDLGGDVPLVLSNRVLKDGAWVSMPDGFPKMETQGGSAIFIFRFPKFTDNAVYDPIIGMGETIEDASPGDSSPGGSSPESSKDPAPSPSSSPATIFDTNAARPSGPMAASAAVLATGMLWSGLSFWI